MSTQPVSPPTTSLNLVPLYGTWLDMNGTGMKPGTYVVSIPARLTSDVDETIIPGGVWASGALSTTPGTRSMSIMAPATDDPAIRETGWFVHVVITFDDGTHESYTVEVPLDAATWMVPGVNLKDQIEQHKIPFEVANYKIAQPGGLVTFNEDGSITNPVTGEPISSGAAATTADYTGYVAAYNVALDSTTTTNFDQAFTDALATGA